MKPEIVLQIERKIGYTFRDKALLQTCFTHASYNTERYGGENNERLEFLGDAVLGFLVADELYRKGRGDEGDMTALRIRLVSAKPLERAVRSMGLQQYLLYPPGASVGEKAVSSLFEAIVAGIYLDGGLDSARTFVRTHLLRSVPSEQNYKGELQEFLQARKFEKATYRVIERTGAAHAPHFKVEVLGAGERAQGEGSSVREAEKAAAKRLLALFNQERGE